MDILGDTNMLLEKISNLEAFKKNKMFFALLASFIKKGRLNNAIPLLFSTSADLKTKILKKNRLAIFFDGSWNEKVDYILKFANSFGFIIDDNILKIFQSNQIFDDLFFGVALGDDSHVERIKIYFNLRKDYHGEFKNKEVCSHILENLNFKKPKIISSLGRLDSFALDVYRNNDINLKIYAYIDIFGFDKFIAEVKNRYVRDILSILRQNILKYNNDNVMICHKINKEGCINELKKVDIMLKQDLEQSSKIVKQLLQIINFKENYKLPLAHFKETNFNCVTVDLKNKITFYYFLRTI